jgi:hypothetical protein
LRKPRAYAEIWNDLDHELVNLMRVLRDEKRAARLIRELELTPFARGIRRSLSAGAIRPRASSPADHPELHGIRLRRRLRHLSDRLSRQQQSQRHDAGARLEQLSEGAGGDRRADEPAS